jgi:hypothetical protein
VMVRLKGVAWWACSVSIRRTMSDQHKLVRNMHLLQETEVSTGSQLQVQLRLVVGLRCAYWCITESISDILLPAAQVKKPLHQFLK